jgi:hypothetical protein
LCHDGANGLLGSQLDPYVFEAGFCALENLAGETRLEQENSESVAEPAEYPKCDEVALKVSKDRLEETLWWVVDDSLTE